MKAASLPAVEILDIQVEQIVSGVNGSVLLRPVDDRVVESWDWARDSKERVSGPAFNVTFHTFSDELARIYVKERVNRPLGEEIERFVYSFAPVG